MIIKVEEKAVPLCVLLEQNTKGTAYSDITIFVSLLVWEESSQEISV